jgi:peptidyl-prolyl cis-trans isomerase B (cyclophilin B)
MPNRLPFTTFRSALVSGLAAGLMCACGGAQHAQPAPRAAVRPALDADRCVRTQAPAPKHVQFSAPGPALKAGTRYTATVATNCGEFKIALDSTHAPKTAGSFKFLADKRFYNGLAIHRVVPGFVFQGGDPQGSGNGGPGYSVVERPPRHLHYRIGDVAMAKRSTEPAGASGSQFFVVTGPDAGRLPPDYARLGKVIAGQSVVEKIGAIITDPRTDRPDAPVVIRSITVTEAAAED